MAKDTTGAQEHPKAAAVRKTANALADAIDGARKAGIAVTWPSRLEALRTITVSETSKVVAEGEGSPDTLAGTKVPTEPVKVA